MHIINTLGPVFIVIALGVLLTKSGFLTAESRRILNACCYWIGLPSLLVMKLGTAEAVGDAARTTLTVTICGTVVLGLAAWLYGWWRGMEPRRLATFVHVVFRGNLAYIGLPVVCFAFSESEYAAKAAAVAAITLGTMVVIYNVAAVLIHLLATHAVNLRALERVLVKLLTNPLLVGCAVGFAWNFFFQARGIEMPIFLSRTLNMLGGFALPLALLCIGSALAVTPLRSVAGGSLPAALLKTGLGPLAAFGLARAFGADAMETGIAAVMLGAPTAVASYVLTEQLDGDPPLAAAAIVLSTVFSAVGFAVILSLIG